MSGSEHTIYPSIDRLWRLEYKVEIMYYPNEQFDLVPSFDRFLDKHDGHAPKLAAVMLHLTSKVTGFGEAERNWKDIKFI